MSQKPVTQRAAAENVVKEIRRATRKQLAVWSTCSTGERLRTARGLDLRPQRRGRPSAHPAQPSCGSSHRRLDSTASSSPLPTARTYAMICSLKSTIYGSWLSA